MSRTYRKREVSGSSPRDLQEKRPKQALRRQLEEEAEESFCPWCPNNGDGCKVGNHNHKERAK